MLTKIKKNRNVSLILFNLPFLALFLIFFVYPFIVGLFMSFTNSNGLNGKYDFIGLKNYIELFTKDNRFYSSLFITTTFTVFSVAISNVFALLLAFFIESGIKFKNGFRTLFFLPYVFALVIIGFVWRFIYAQWLPGFAEYFHLGFLNQDFMGNPKLALFSAIIMQVWYNTGYFLVIYIAGMQTIDKSLIESANIDGARTFTLYTKIIMPLLMPSVTVCLFTGIASAFKAFDSVLSLTGGGPGFATEVLSLNIYYDAMGSDQAYGYGMSKAMVMALIIFIVSFIQLNYFKKKEVEM